MPKQPMTMSLEMATIETIKRLAAETRRNPGAIVDLAIELYDQVENGAKAPVSAHPGRQHPQKAA